MAKRRQRPGPRSALTPARLDKLCELLSAGRTMRDVCRISEIGCSYSAVKRAARESKRVQKRIRDAQDASEGAMLGKIGAAGEKQPQCYMWLLERMKPERYGRRNPEAITPRQLTTVMMQVATAVMPLVPPERQTELVAKFQSILNDPLLFEAKKTDRD